MMVVFMLSVRVFSRMCPDCVACIVFAGFCFPGCLFLFSFVCSVGSGCRVRVACFVGLAVCFVWSGPCVRDRVRLVHPCFSVWSCRPVFFDPSCFPLCGLACFCLACSRLSFLRLLFFGVPFFCVSRSAGAVRPACAPCGARVFPFRPFVPYRRPRARRRMMRMPRYSPRAKRRMACTALRRPCARPARVVPAGGAGRRAARRVSSGSCVVSGV